MRPKTPTRISPRVMLPMLLCALLLPAIPGTAYSEDNAPLRLTLPQAIDLALKQNRSLKLAQLAVVDSGHKKEIARSAYFPHIKNESAVLHLTELAGVEIPSGSLRRPARHGGNPRAKRLRRPGIAHHLYQRHRAGTTTHADVQDPRIEPCRDCRYKHRPDPAGPGRERSRSQSQAAVLRPVDCPVETGGRNRRSERQPGKSSGERRLSRARPRAGGGGAGKPRCGARGPADGSYTKAADPRPDADAQ